MKTQKTNLTFSIKFVSLFFYNKEYIIQRSPKANQCLSLIVLIKVIALFIHGAHNPKKKS